MALETKLIQKLSQSLLMTPQLQQAIKLLQLGRLEYKEAIEKELLDNPVLEEVKEAEDEASYKAASPTDQASSNGDSGEESSEAESQNPIEQQAQGTSVDWEDYLENFADARGTASPKGMVDFEDRPGVEGVGTKAENLAEHLAAQIRFMDIPEEEKEIVLNIIGNLNKDGYLCASYDEIAQECHCNIADVERVVEIFRSIDPIGVAARDLAECLTIQLEARSMADSLASKIVTLHLDKVEKRKYDAIAKAENVPIDDVYRAVSIIQELEPRPGRQFSDEATRYIVPDIYVYKVGNEYVITQNEDGLPKLRISPYYLDILKRKDGGDKANHEYLAERLKAASWLIKSIHQRQHTIYRVTESIVKFQKEFLDHGIERLKPLVLKEVADDIGMHESTVSRVTTNKYVHTPQGVFELKFFFTTGIKTANGDVSSSTIKEKIRGLIIHEDALDPISDQRIVEILAKDNIEIARRTVAKYRETLGILSSSKRKKPF